MTKPWRWRRGLFAAVVLGMIALLGSACSGTGPQDFLHPAGYNAQKADDLWNIVFVVATVIFVIVEGLLVYAVVKFRHRPGREASQFHGNPKVEVLLTVIPALILAGIAIPTIRTIFELSAKPSDAMPVTVIAHQFWWEYQYPGQQVVTANELHIPTGRNVLVTVKGEPTDLVTGLPEVIHSFWVPRLAGKQDVVPGHTNTIILFTNTPGTYKGQCTEFCGLGHAYMRLRVIAESPTDFENWILAQQHDAEPPSKGSLAATGASLFQNGAGNGQFPNGPACSACHSLTSSPIDKAVPRVGPNLGHLADRSTFAGSIFDRTDANLAAWLNSPSAVKPGARMPTLGLTSDQIKALVAYLDTLK